MQVELYEFTNRFHLLLLLTSTSRYQKILKITHFLFPLGWSCCQSDLARQWRGLKVEPDAACLDPDPFRQKPHRKDNLLPAIRGHQNVLHTRFYDRRASHSGNWHIHGGNLSGLPPKGKIRPIFQIIVFYFFESHPNGFYWGHRCSSTLTPTNKQIYNM